MMSSAFTGKEHKLKRDVLENFSLLLFLFSLHSENNSALHSSWSASELIFDKWVQEKAGGSREKAIH